MDNNSLHDLKELAKQGDMDAIAELVKQTLKFRNLKVTAERYGENGLRLKIYPNSTLQPLSCIPKIIDLFNDLCVPKVLIIAIHEFESDQKTLEWHRILEFKKDHFVDSTKFINSIFMTISIVFLGIIISSLGYCALPRRTSIQTTTINVETNPNSDSSSESRSGIAGYDFPASGSPAAVYCDTNEDSSDTTLLSNGVRYNKECLKIYSWKTN